MPKCDILSNFQTMWYWPKNCIKNLDGFGANETYHTIWSKNPFPFSTLRKKTSLPSNDLSACDWVERLLPPFCHLFLMVSLSPLLAFQQLLSYQNFAASRKGWWESAKTRWWNQPWCSDGSCLLEGLWPTAFTLLRVAPSSTTVEVARLSKARKTPFILHYLKIIIPKVSVFEFSCQK